MLTTRHRRGRRTAVLVVLALLSVSLVNGCGHGKTGKVWKSAQSLAAKLGPEVTLDGYAFR